MAEKSAISWTKSTFNPWIGCTKVGPGCDNCYASVSTPARSMAIKWGAGEPRRRTSASNWTQPLKWNKYARESEFAGRKGFWPVFCASLADVFDNEVSFEWREDLWKLIHETPNLSWLLVTKRIGNVAGRVPLSWSSRWPDNVRLLITVVNQEEADRDIPRLLALPCKNGISYEPALGKIDFGKWLILGRWDATGMELPKRGIEWIIVGGESSQSGARARIFDIDWARNTVEQCKSAGIPVFVKQLGSDARIRIGDTSCLLPIAPRITDRAGANPAEWPADIRVQEFPV